MPACDRCNAIKSKCVRIASRVECERCYRLSHVCTYRKTPKPRGRRSQEAQQPSSRELVWVQVIPPPLMQSTYMNLSPGEFELLRIMTEGPGPDVAGSVAVAPSRFAEVRTSINARLASAPALLQRPFVAFFRAASRSMQGQPARDDTDLARMGDAMRSLRIANTDDLDALGNIFTLARCLANYELTTAGRSAHIIYRNVLTRLRPYHLEDVPEIALRDDILCLVWMDTIESLIRRRLPVLKYPVSDIIYVDSFTGVSRTLLPLLYDVCQIGMALKTKISIDDSLVDRVEHAVENWRPVLPLENLPEAEVISLCTHAKMYKAATLLVLQQHRTPPRRGTEQAMSMIKYAEYCIAQIGYIPPYTMTPLLIAGVVLTEEEGRQRLQTCMGSISSSVTFLPYRNFLRFLKLVWGNHEAGSQASWLDSLDSMPYFNSPP